MAARKRGRRKSAKPAVRQARAKWERARKTSKPGSGARFSACVRYQMARGYSETRARRICASIGRKKYGNKQFQTMAAAGRKGK